MTDDAKPFIRPEVATFLGYLAALPGPRVWELAPPAARSIGRASRDVVELATGPLAVLRDVTMPGPAGPLRLRVHDARESRGPGPVMVFLHGGGFVLGDLDIYEPLCAEIARRLDLPVVSVDYRLAPEHPFPAAPDDCEAAARWIASAPPELGLAPTGLVLAGDSAGGTLAIVTAMALRDAPAAVPAIAQWAIYPATDAIARYPSYGAFKEGYFLTEDAMRWFDTAYAADKTSWRGSPLLASVAGLPPALVVTAGLDPIRDQGRAYAAALATAGVPVTFHEAQGTIHGFIYMRRALPSAQADLATCLALLAPILAGASA